MVEVITTKRHPRPGQRLRITAREAKVLVVLGKAEYVTDAAEAETKPARRTYKRRDMQVEQPAREHLSIPLVTKTPGNGETT